jgi:hypothetical protein
MKISWVTIDRFCQDEAQANEGIRHLLKRNDRPLRSSAAALTDDELLAKLEGFGVDAGRGRVGKLSRRPADDREPPQGAGRGLL